MPIEQQLAAINGEIDYVRDMSFDKKCPYTWGMKVPEKWGCFDRSDLVVLAGYPSCGKTELTYFLARKNADIGVKVLYVSLELTPQSLLERIARKKAAVSKKEFQEKRYTEQQRDLMNQNFKYYRDYPNIKLIGFEKSPTIDDLERSINTYKEQGYDLFFIDNLGKIAGDNNEIVRFTETTNRLQTLKNNLNTCIFLLHHMGKPPRSKEYEAGGISGIRGSQKVIDNATMVLELWRDLDPDRDVDTTTLSLLKDTFDGETGKLFLSFHKSDYEVKTDKDLGEKSVPREKSYHTNQGEELDFENDKTLTKTIS